MIIPLKNKEAKNSWRTDRRLKLLMRRDDVFTWDNANSDVHLFQWIGVGRGYGAQADEEASHHHHRTTAKAVAHHCWQWSCRRADERLGQVTEEQWVRNTREWRKTSEVTNLWRKRRKHKWRWPTTLDCCSPRTRPSGPGGRPPGSWWCRRCRPPPWKRPRPQPSPNHHQALLGKP